MSAADKHRDCDECFYCEAPIAPMQVAALKECGPLGRIYLAKVFAIQSDREHLADTG